MKTVKLTDYECKVILDNLSVYSICNSGCYCDYEEDNCSKLNKDGTYKCKLRKALNSIESKVGGLDC